MSSKKHLSQKMTLDDGGDAIDPVIMAKLKSFDPVKAAQEMHLKMLDPTEIEIRKAREAERDKARQKLRASWGFTSKEGDLKTQGSNESLADVSVLDGVVSIKFRDPALAGLWVNDIRNFIKRGRSA